ncbi:MAG TPA: asparagine synthase (glutamine-hydrolyzing) [Pyrinomonadaceae bacterium]|jgi:asparagine synthase (glutamine-hydrolysing)|nr:asparagine synthase (glutamine-hydrolyzing) [Pyrinomonadaceae bacterium]
MCGIAGLAGFGDAHEARRRVRQMLSTLTRRGPDGEGLEVWSSDRGLTTVLGHRRLSIFDLSDAGRQPMLSPDSSVGITFNGAIYNFRELRVELESSGYKFKSHTDTEVLVHGYNAWGLDRLLERIRGMYALALWDDRKRTLFLVRDRLGVKPLLYSTENGQIAFASTARALRAGGFAGEIDDLAIADYLEFGYVTDDRSIYRGVSKVAAGTVVEWSNGNIRTREYWRPPTPTSNQPSFDEAVAETERLFLRAVERRLFADVPVGSLLSGGVDSSLVCWAIAHLGGDVTAFTVGTPGDPADETADATDTAKHLGIRHQVLELSGDSEPNIDELVSAYGEPFACASALGMLRVSKAVRGSATVLLTGDGGDDVFLGYPEHRHLWLAQRLARSLPGFVANGWRGNRDKVPQVGSLKRLSSFLNYSTGGLGAVACAHDGLPSYERYGMLGERLAGVSVAQRDIEWSNESGRNVLAEFLEYDRANRFVGEYMTKVDGATMFHSLEARSPFLDQDLWEFAAGLSFETRLHGGKLKSVLRELAKRKLGERVSRGRKRGFTIPVQRWLVGRWQNALTELLQPSILDREGWINSRATLDRLSAAAKEGWAPNQLWYIFVLESWLRHEQSSGIETVNEVFDHEGATVFG